MAIRPLDDRQEKDCYQIRFDWPEDAPGIELGLPDCEFGVLTTTLCGNHDVLDRKRASELYTNFNLEVDSLDCDVLRSSRRDENFR